MTGIAHAKISRRCRFVDTGKRQAKGANRPRIARGAIDLTNAPSPGGTDAIPSGCQHESDA